MDLSKLPLFALIGRKMGWLAERQKVLAENVANADTPGFKARDLKAMDFASLAADAARLAPAATDRQHLAHRASASAAAVVKGRPVETTLSGNTVSLEAEMMKVSETAMDYQLISNIYRKQLDMIRAAIGRGQS